MTTSNRLTGRTELGERHRADVDRVEPLGRHGARRRRIESHHVRESTFAEVREQAAACAADIQDAGVRPRHVRRDDPGNDFSRRWSNSDSAPSRW